MPSAIKADEDVESQEVTSTMKKVNTHHVHAIVSHHSISRLQEPAAKPKKPIHEFCRSTKESRRIILATTVSKVGLEMCQLFLQLCKPNHYSREGG
jgi:hypothetical protein